MILPVVVIAAGIGISTFWIIDDHKSKNDAVAPAVTAQTVSAGQTIAAEGLTTQDHCLVQRVFNSPEKLDADGAVSLSNTDVVEAVRHPLLMSEIEPVQPIAVAAYTTENRPLYFQKDFESLRTDAVRNPDSAQNRATVSALMQKRHQRLEQK